MSSPFVDILGPAYARNILYWQSLLYSCVGQGLVMGGVALGFYNYFDVLMRHTWLTGDYAAAIEYVGPGAAINITSSKDDLLSAGVEHQAAVAALRLGGGEWYYVGMLAGAGLATGIIKIVWSRLVSPFPDKPPGFLEELAALHADDLLLPVPMLVASGLALGLGASVGPEAALGATGSALGTFLGRRWKIGPFQALSRNPNVDEEEPAPAGLAGVMAWLLPDFSSRTDMCALEGLAAAFGTIFPTQLLSPLMIHELGRHWGPGGRFQVAETVARTGLAASIGYGVFMLVKQFTLLGSYVLPSALYDDFTRLTPGLLSQAILLGIVSGLIGFFGVVMMFFTGYIGKVTFVKLNMVGDKYSLPKGLLGTLLTPMIGGIIAGLLAVAAPLTLGSGAEQMAAVFRLAPLLGRSTLIVTALLKVTLVGLCLGFGFVGGPFFPYLMAGACVGSTMSLVFPRLPLLVSFACCQAAVPVVFMPAIFSMTSIVSLSFVLGGPVTSAVFIACIASYSTICGLGLIQSFVPWFAHWAAPRPKVDTTALEDASNHVPIGNPLLESAYSASSRNVSLPTKAQTPEHLEQVVEETPSVDNDDNEAPANDR